jgi:hypothetical protein
LDVWMKEMERCEEEEEDEGEEEEEGEEEGEGEGEEGEEEEEEELKKMPTWTGNEIAPKTTFAPFARRPNARGSSSTCL